jgi:hypothetical protein
MNHLEFAAAETAALLPHPYERWCEAVEAAFGHSADGDEDENGYCMDLNYEAWSAGKSPEAYVEECRAKPNYSVRLYANGLGFPKGEERRAGKRCHVVIDAATGTVVLGHATEAEYGRWYDQHCFWRKPRDLSEVAPDLRAAFQAAAASTHYLINDR